MGLVHTPEFRVSYPKVFKAELNKLAKREEFSLQALFSPKADMTKLKKACQEAVIEKWGPDPKKWPKNLRLPFRDQADREKERDDGSKFMPEGYVKGATYLNLRSTKRPGVVDKDVQPIIAEEDFYAGCFAIATVNAAAYEQGANCGVSLWLNNLQKTRDGEPLSGRSKAEDDFAPVTGGNDAEASDASTTENPFA